jgi:hypothetical protein
MGRQKKTELEKKLAGNPGRRQVRDDIEVQAIADPSPPPGMDENQAAYWHLYAPYMVKNGLLTDLNRKDLERLCMVECKADQIFRDMAVGELPEYQEKKNYHGEAVDIVESIYSKHFRHFCTIIRTLKADLRIRTDKLNAVIKKEKKSKFGGLLNGGKK